MSYKGFSNPQLLMSPQDLKKRLGEPSLCLVDTRATHEYATGHIPGAIHLDFFNISLADTRRKVFDAFMSMMGYLMFSRGISFDKTVVFYENIAGMRAARGFWFCEYLGLKDVRVLDDGLAAWTKAGYPVTTECTAPERGSMKTAAPARPLAPSTASTARWKRRSISSSRSVPGLGRSARR